MASAMKKFELGWILGLVVIVVTVVIYLHSIGKITVPGLTQNHNNNNNIHRS